MAKITKCKICGDTEFTEVGELLQCRSCKHKTPKPKENAELLERANNLRFETKSFDEAANLYEEIIRITPDEAEAYWGRVLCRYGIEYVKDNDGRYLPTCHRTLEGSILDDGDYKMAVMKAERGMSQYYMAEAQTIDEYQTKIKVIAAKEEPYDVFISFKATDEFGRPTEDSLLAQELYYYLTKNLGLKVFFSNITLKDKAGQEYEPIIYAALSSATVMVLVGTKPEYVNATWVKNEWSRYAKMVAEARAQNKSKYIVTALKDMRPEQLPSVLASYQAVNLAELGAKEKLCSNIDSLIGDLRVQSNKAANTGGGFNADDMLSAEAKNLCNLGYQQLTTKNFAKAGEYFEKAIEKKSNAALAHWGMLLATQGASDDNELADKRFNIKENPYYKLAMQYASGEEKMRFARIDSLVDASLAREAAVICSGGFEKLQSGDFEAADTLFSNAIIIKAEISLAYWGKLLVSQGVRSDEELASRAMDLQNNELFISAMGCASPTEKERYNDVLAQISIQIEKRIQTLLDSADKYLQSEDVSVHGLALSSIAEASSLKEDIPGKYYWQLLRMFAGAADDEMFSQIPYPVKDDIYYQRALKYANPAEAARYQRIAEQCQNAFGLENAFSAVYCKNCHQLALFIPKSERANYLKKYSHTAIVEVPYSRHAFNIQTQKFYNPEDVLDEYMLKYIARHAVADRKELLAKNNVSLYMHATPHVSRGYGLDKALGISYSESKEILSKAPCYIAHNLSLEKARELFIAYSKCNVHVCIHSRPIDDIIQSSEADVDPNKRVSVYLTEIGWTWGGHVRKWLQKNYGMDKAKAKEITNNLPSLIATNIPLSDAKKIVDSFAEMYSKAEIRMQ